MCAIGICACMSNSPTHALQTGWSKSLYTGCRYARAFLKPAISLPPADTHLTEQVATIFSVAVDPSFQRLGVGERLIDRLTSDLYTRHGIADIGAVASPGTEPFFNVSAEQSAGQGERPGYQATSFALVSPRECAGGRRHIPRCLPCQAICRHVSI